MSEQALHQITTRDEAEEARPWWVVDDNFRLLSLPLNVRSQHMEFAEALRWHLEPFRRRAHEGNALALSIFARTDEKDGKPTYRYVRGNELAHESPFLSLLLTHVVWDIHAHVPKYVRDFLLLHSGAVSTGEGALLLPGPTGIGKSSLVLGLLNTGFQYLSDELGALDPVTSKVYPFGKRITLSEPALGFLPHAESRLEDRQVLWGSPTERYVRPEDVGSAIAAPGIPRWLVFPSKDREGRPRLTPMSAAATVAELAANCLNLSWYGERGLIMLSRVARQSQSYWLEGGSVPERVSLLAEHFSG